jgi:hypothetical protein
VIFPTELIGRISKIEAVVAGNKLAEAGFQLREGKRTACMTFDELWRIDLARKRAFTDMVDKVEEVKPFDHLAFSRFGSDDLDDGDDLDGEEVDRFLEWLEESLPSADPNIPAID